jgi:hydroxymethylpyrimidine pyrophosphatase-like HAD family hydrolase
MKKILHVSDLDGTLLDKSSKVPEYTEEVINKMIDIYAYLAG